MAITQVGVATLSDELLAYIKEQIKTGTLEWTDLTDTPDYTGNDGKFLRARSGGGSSSMVWEDLPISGLNWRSVSSDMVIEDKIGAMASNGITLTLPSDPIEGTMVAVADPLSEFDLKPVTVEAANGYLIEGDTELVLDLRNAYVQLIFDGIQWEMIQVNHPFNIQEITEENFPGGRISYSLSRIPPSSSSILVTSGGYVIPSTKYNLTGNTLIFGTSPIDTVYIRYLGVPTATKVSETPVGAMMYFPNTTPVDGWLDCTGGSIGRSLYPDLVAYLTKDVTADIAYLPDARGNFIRTWDQGNGSDSVPYYAIPPILKDNTWGRWIDTTEPGTTTNLWDGNNATRTVVRSDRGYVGYQFDTPVKVDRVNITSSDLQGVQHLPTSMQLKASVDGVSWINASPAITGNFQDVTTTLESSITDEYRFWAVFGTGGYSYPTNLDYYWGLTSLVITGESTTRTVGGFQSQAVGQIDLTLGGASAGTGQIAAGTGETGILTGGSDSVYGGPETRPNNQAYILRIKAFHYQSGSMIDSDVTILRSEVTRLSSQVTDLENRVIAVENP